MVYNAIMSPENECQYQRMYLYTCAHNYSYSTVGVIAQLGSKYNIPVRGCPVLPFMNEVKNSLTDFTKKLSA